MPPHKPDLSAFAFVPGGPDLPPEQLVSANEYRRQTRLMSLVNDIFMRACFQGQREEGVAIAHNLYNIEIQLDPRGANPKRPRYILSVIDSSVKNPGKHFEHLHETFSIFIVQGDPFDKENPQPLYVFTRRTEDGRPLGDGTTIIYVNAQMQNYITWLGLLMHDLCCVNPDEMFFPELQAITRHFKEDTEGVIAMKNMSESIFEEGWKGGREEGRSENQRSTASRMLAAGKLTIEEIAEYAALPLAEVRALADQLRGA